MNRKFSWITASLLVASLGLLDCSAQGEGERCDPNNNNEDCASGLTCQSIEGQTSPLCCPPPPQSASVSACIPGQIIQNDSGTPNETGTDTGDDAPDDTTDDTTTDTSVDSPDETGTDAPEDAPLEVAVDVGPEAEPDAEQDAPADVSSADDAADGDG